MRVYITCTSPESSSTDVQTISPDLRRTRQNVESWYDRLMAWRLTAGVVALPLSSEIPISRHLLPVDTRGHLCEVLDT